MSRRHVNGVVLTKRQLQVLDLIWTGISRDEIAAQLGLSTDTINFHMGRMLRATHSRSMLALCRRALNAGLLKP